jgi:hypothetical protein
MTKFLRGAALGAMLVIMSGCLTEPGPKIDTFTWQVEPDPNEIVEGVTIAALFSDISFLGQTKTPTQCYRATSKLTVDGSTLTVNINIENSGATNCNQQPAGVRYSGSIQNLSPGTYTVHIIQNVSGVGVTEYNQSVKL